MCQMNAVSDPDSKHCNASLILFNFTVLQLFTAALRTAAPGLIYSISCVPDLHPDSRILTVKLRTQILPFSSLTFKMLKSSLL